MKDWPTPTSITEVQKFLGLVSYYRRYTCQFADIAAPMYALTRKGASFVWTSECVQAFATLKDKLMTAPILGYPCFDQDASQFKLQTDASAVGLGATLKQEGHVVACTS